MKSILRLPALLLCAAGIAAACTDPAPRPAAEPRLRTDSLLVPDDALSFLVVGDFGRNGYHHQADVARRMDEAAEALDAEFVVTTGDNFYDNGVASPQDPLIQSAFERVYDGSFLQIDWLVALGNHEYRGNVDALIEYSRVSRRWNLPARYYARSFALEDGQRVEFFVIDTSPFISEYYHEEQYAKAVAAQDTTAQLEWLEAALSASTARWKIAVGHHPMATGGRRRDDPREIMATFRPIFERHGVDAYFSGHEHDLQHIVFESGPEQFISGAGASVRPTGELPETRFAASVSGFMTASVTPGELTVQAIDWQGNVLYRTAIRKP